MSYQDELHAHQEHLAVASRHRRLFDSEKLTAEIPEPYTAPQDGEAALTHEDCDAAVREVAEREGKSLAEVDSLVRLTAQRADLGFSVPERVKVINEVSKALGRRLREPDREQIVKLSRRDEQDGEAGRLAADHAGILGLTVTQEQRERYAKSGVALGDGHFPIHDAKHLGFAKQQYRKGNLAGHSKAEVKAHINKHAKRLNLLGLDDDSGDGAGLTVTLSASAGPAELARHAAVHGESADAIAARYPELFGR